MCGCIRSIVTPAERDRARSRRVAQWRSIRVPVRERSSGPWSHGIELQVAQSERG